MDPNRFDHVARSLARRLTRRGMIASAGAGGLATAALGAAPSLAADGAVTCVYDFDGTIDIGPSSTIAQNNAVAGELTITIKPNGAIDSGKLVRLNGDLWRVVGEATGRAISLRISVPDTGAIIAVGTGRKAIAGCTSEMDGPASGPLRKDMGSWRAILKTGTEPPTPAAAATDSTAPAVDVEPTAPPTTEPEVAASPEVVTEATSSATCQLICGADTLGLDPASCSCLCPDGTTLCIAQAHASHAKGGVIFQPSVSNPLGFCIDPSSDPSNCGGCFTACAGTTPACVAGVCVAA